MKLNEQRIREHRPFPSSTKGKSFTQSGTSRLLSSTRALGSEQLKLRFFPGKLHVQTPFQHKIGRHLPRLGTFQHLSFNRQLGSEQLWLHFFPSNVDAGTPFYIETASTCLDWEPFSNCRRTDSSARKNQGPTSLRATPMPQRRSTSERAGSYPNSVP